MTFDDILLYFKEQESGSPENIAPLIENRDLIDSLIAWKSVNTSRKDSLGECIGQSDNEKWEWLWQNVTFDLNSFAGVAGIRYQDASQLFYRLKGLRLIYPDSTINTIAKQYLQGVIIRMIKKKEHQVPKKT